MASLDETASLTRMQVLLNRAPNAQTPMPDQKDPLDRTAVG
jgi:hypothetical protein